MPNLRLLSNMRWLKLSVTSFSGVLQLSSVGQFAAAAAPA